MKRFYCTVCQRIRRVRHWPMNIERRVVDKPGDDIRRGECDRHYGINNYAAPVARKVAR